MGLGQPSKRDHSTTLSKTSAQRYSVSVNSKLTKRLLIKSKQIMRLPFPSSFQRNIISIGTAAGLKSEGTQAPLSSQKVRLVSDLIVKPLSVKYGMGISKHDTEGRAITCEFKKVPFFKVIIVLLCLLLLSECDEKHIEQTRLQN